MQIVLKDRNRSFVVRPYTNFRSDDGKPLGRYDVVLWDKSAKRFIRRGRTIAQCAYCLPCIH